MIKLKVFKPKVKLKAPKKVISGLNLKLIKEGKKLFVVDCDEDGEINWYLLRINPNGTFSRCTALPDMPGLQLVGNGMIKETPE